MFDFGSSSNMKDTNNKIHLNGLSEEKKTGPILTFDVYGNVTSSTNESIGFNNDIQPYVEYDFLNNVLGSFEKTEETPLIKDFEKKTKSPKKGKATKRLTSSTSKPKKIKPENGDAISPLSVNELKSAFKEEFDASSLVNSTSRYGRTRKLKSVDEGFLSGTINFNELRKLTANSPSPKKQISNNELQVNFNTTTNGSKSGDLPDISNGSKSGDLPDISKSFNILIENNPKYSSEDEFEPEKSNFKNENSCKSDKKYKRKSQPSPLNNNSSDDHQETKNVSLIEYDSKKSSISPNNKKGTRKSLQNDVEEPKIKNDNLLDKELHLNGEKAENSEFEVLPILAYKIEKSNSIDEDISILREFSPNKIDEEKHKTSIVESEMLEELPETTNIPEDKEPQIKEETPEVETNEASNSIEEQICEIQKQNCADLPLTEPKTENAPVAIIEEGFLEATEEEEFLQTLPCLHFVGDLVWVVFKGSPIWPGIICYPGNENEFTNIVTNKKKKRFRQYHIKFLCDNQNRLWVKSGHLVLYEGKEKLKKYFKELTDKDSNNKSKNGNIMESMKKANYLFGKENTKIEVPPRVRVQRWYAAVELAEHGMTLNRFDRIQKLVDEVRKSVTIPVLSKKLQRPEAKPQKLPRKISEGEFSGFEEFSSEESCGRRQKLDDTLQGRKQMPEESQRNRRQVLSDTLKDENLDEFVQKHMDALFLEDSILGDQKKSRRKSRITDYFDVEESGSECSSLSSGKSKRSDEDLEEGSKGTYRIVRNEKVCFACEDVSLKSGGTDMVKCRGLCNGTFHFSCVGASPETAATWRCVTCTTKTHDCFVCKGSDQPIVKCSVHSCGKFYHDACIREWPQVSKGKQTEKLICPRHVCHMCAANADDMNDISARTHPYTRCLRCPTTYHTGELCGAAGMEEISINYHICTKHMDVGMTRKNMNILHSNVNWCFCCSKGGSLLLCDQCPAAFHAECMGITAPEGGYVCEDCVNGKFPVYGDIVWVKLGSSRWWPGQVLHPRFIPDNIEKLPHFKGTFCIHFFGSNDYYWMSRGRAFHYQEGDQGSKGRGNKPKELVFQKAMSEAKDAFLKQKERREQYEETLTSKGKLKPPPYVRIDTNRPVGNVRLGKVDASHATKCDCDPYSDNPCGSDDKCINRMLMVECIREVCPAGDRCQNQRFQKRQYPNVFPFKTSERGWGLKTKDSIKKGDFVIEYVGELIDDTEFRRRIVEMHEFNEENYYFLTVETDRMIDAGPKGNLARFMNHSCQPICETQKWTVGADTRVGLFALQDIEPNSELNFNYNLECVGTEKKVCNCGAPMCSGFIGSKVQKTESSKNGQKQKKKKKKRLTKVKETDNDCFRCGLAGDLILCDSSSCPKGYHLQCLGLAALPKGGWICPWHHCDECGHRSMAKCNACPNSFCRVHSTDQFHPGAVSICLDHSEAEAQAFQSQVKEEEIDMDSPPTINGDSQNEILNSNSSVAYPNKTSKKSPAKKSPKKQTQTETIDLDFVPPKQKVERRGRPRKYSSNSTKNPTTSGGQKRKRESSSPLESAAKAKKRRILRSLNESHNSSDGDRSHKQKQQEIVECKEN